MTRLLVDRAVWDGSARALPRSWLEGFAVTTFAADRPDELAAGLRETEGLLIRSVTRLPAEMLQHARQLRVVATLSSGLDHLDPDDLARRGVTLCSGHGGNARAVADWVHWALSRAWQGDLAGRKVLIVGVGAVGSAVRAVLERSGATTVACDPPRAEREPGFASVDLDLALRQGGLDAVTLHVPFERGGRHPTVHLIDRVRLEQLPGAVVLNAARGGVLDETAALDLKRAGRLRALAIDTWAGEPCPDPALVAACDVATPHIAGHSIEGKLDVAARAVRGLRAQLGLPDGAVDLAAAIAETVAACAGDLAPAAALDASASAFRDALGRSGLAPAEAAAAFRALRHGHARVQRAV